MQSAQKSIKFLLHLVRCLNASETHVTKERERWSNSDILTKRTKRRKFHNQVERLIFSKMAEILNDIARLYLWEMYRFSVHHFKITSREQTKDKKWEYRCIRIFISNWNWFNTEYLASQNVLGFKNFAECPMSNLFNQMISMYIWQCTTFCHM